MTAPDGTPAPADATVGEWRLTADGWVWVDLDFTRPPAQGLQS